MRREYVETISSQAAPSPARHLLTSSAPSPTVTAPATPTSRPFDSLRGLPEKRAARVVNPLSNGHYDRRKGKVPAPPGAAPPRRRPAARGRTSGAASVRGATSPAVTIIA